MTTSGTRSLHDSFPRWVALASLLLALWVFFTNTVPAAREREELTEVAFELKDLRRRFDGAIQERRIGLAQDHSVDLQAVLVAIDQQGLTPAELCASHPLPKDGESPAAPGKFR
ncbi:MAG: hypothetical protein RL398_2830 [Planctomycetota bacterium]|jgi:hypothetical protein